MAEGQKATDANEGESEGVPEALGRLQTDRTGRTDNRRWRYAVREVGALTYGGTGRWRQIGPAPLLIDNQQIFQGIGPDSGEFVDIAIDPRGGPQRVLYAVAGSGGLWKSVDDGQSWQPVTDQLPGTELGAVGLDPADPDTIYLGTGNMFEGASGMAKAFGLFKSTDGGRSWARLATPAGRAPQPITGAVNNGGGIRLTVTGHGYSSSDRVSVVGLPGLVGQAAEGIVTRIDPDTLRIAGLTITGSYSGSGASLFDARQAPFLSDNGVIRIVCPTPGTVLVAAENGLYYSADGGRNFGANHPAFDDGRPIRTGLISSLEVDQGWQRTIRVGDATPVSPIVITAPRHGFASGDHVFLGGVTSNQAANGGWLVQVIDADHFSLHDLAGGDSIGNGTGATTGFVVGPAHPSTVAVQGASNPAAPQPIVITATGHGFVTGDIVAVSGVQGNTAANGSWPIRVLSPDTFALVGSRGNAAAVAGTGVIDGPRHRPSIAITAAINAGGGITITAAGHGMVDGDRVSVIGLPGITAPGNVGSVRRIDDDRLRVAGLTMSGTYPGTGGTLSGPADAWNTVYFVSAGRLPDTNTLNPDRGLFRLTITSTGDLVLSDNLLSHPGGVVGGFGRVVVCQSLLPRTRTLYASVQDRETASIFVGLFRSDDFGTTWQIRPALSHRVNADSADQTTYDLNIGVDPQNAQLVYASTQQLWRSVDGGQSWPEVTPATHGGVDTLDGVGKSPSTTLAHWDHHELVFPPPTRWEWSGSDPAQPTPAYVATDGGIARSGDDAGTMTFTALNEGIATSLLRSLDLGRGAANNAVSFAGMQDTGTGGQHRGGALGGWTSGVDGDGGDVAVDPFDPDIVFGFDNDHLMRTTNGGLTWFLNDSADPIPIESVANENPVRVVTSGHPFRTGDAVTITGVAGGGGIANGAQQITVIDHREFTLNGRNGTGVAAFGAGPSVTGDRYLAQSSITAATLQAPIEIETATPHGCSTGQRVRIDGVAGNLAANNTDARPSWTVTVLSPTRLSLDGSDGSASPAYRAGTGRMRGPQAAGAVRVLRAENATPIVVTAPGHGFVSGDVVSVTGVLGNAAANCTGNPIRVLDANSFVLLGLSGTGKSAAGPQVSGPTIGRGVPTHEFGRERVALVPNGAAASTAVFVSIDRLLFRSQNGGVSFAQVATFGDDITALHAPAPNRLWVGLAGSTNPLRAGTVRFSADGGSHFLGAAQNFVADVGARGPIAAILEDPAVPAGTRVAVVASGYSETATARRTRHAFLTETGGLTVGGAAPWHEQGGVFAAAGVSAAQNLPDVPVMDLGWDTGVTPSALLIATDGGVLRLRPGVPPTPTGWERVGPNLPSVSCQALAVDNSVTPPVIRVGTYGRSAWELITPAGPSLVPENDLGFGEQQVGTTAHRPLVLHSVGAAPVTISDLTGGTGDFVLDSVPAGSLTFPMTLAAGEHRTLDVAFTPTAPGNRGAFLMVSCDDPDHLATELRASGFGVPAGLPRLSTRSFLEFGLVQSGTPAILSAELRNLGSAPLIIDAVQLDAAGSSRFTLPTPPTLPLTVPPGGSTSVDVQFDPNANGPATGAVIVRAGGQGQVINLAGQGTTTAAGILAVLLNALGLSDPPEVLA